MKMDSAQHDRAVGVLLGQACGDALGVPYEFGTPPGPDELAEMTGGGEARRAVIDALPEARGHGALWDAVRSSEVRDEQ